MKTNGETILHEGEGVFILTVLNEVSKTELMKQISLLSMGLNNPGVIVGFDKTSFRVCPTSQWDELRLKTFLKGLNLLS